MTMSRGMMSGVSASAGLAAAQGVWALLAIFAVFSVQPYYDQADVAIRIFALVTLVYMGWQVARSSRIKSIRYNGDLQGLRRIMFQTFQVALTMPLRLPAYIAFFVSISLHVRAQHPLNGVFLATGIGLGSLMWWLYFVVLAAIFGKRVPEWISVKSMNKLRMLAAIVFFSLGVLSIAPLAIKID